MRQGIGTKRSGIAAVLVAIAVSASACVMPLRTSAAADSEKNLAAAPTTAPEIGVDGSGSDDLLESLTESDEALTDREAFSDGDEESSPTSGPFIVGDSTMVEAVKITGRGSAVSGRGFTAEAPGGRNPLAAVPVDYDGLVVMGVSVWDMWSTDLSGYVEATELYRSHGLDVVWVGVPPTGAEFEDGAESPLLVALNDSVEALLGCDLVPWDMRFVEYAEGIHPSVAGAADIVSAASALTADDACEIGA